MKLRNLIVIVGLIALVIALDPDCGAQYTAISEGGYSHTIAIRQDGTLWAWGNNTRGQLGINSTDSTGIATQVGTETDWLYVAAGYNTSFAIKKNGSLYAWGANTYGGLGDGTTTDQLTPVPVNSTATWKVVMSSGNTTIAIQTDGTLWGWGLNARGEIGDDTQNDQHNPVKIGEVNTWTALSVGWGHSFAIQGDGALYGWGHNELGQLGDNTQDDKKAPTHIGTDTWNSVSAGIGQTAAVNKAGALFHWGGSFFDNSTTLIPTQIGTATTWKSVILSEYAAQAIQQDGSYWAWGLNAFGQFGDGTADKSTEPKLIDAKPQFSSISAGWCFSRAINQSNNEVITWGMNHDGVLGWGRVGFSASWTPEICGDSNVCQSNKCSACADGLFKYKLICSACDPNCATCQTTDKYCTKCNADSYLQLSDHTCVGDCDKNCSTCEATTTNCTSCKDTHDFVDIHHDNVCATCDDNCLTCHWTSIMCLTCKDGEFLEATSKCAACDPMCATCKGTNTTCLTCPAGRYFNNDTNGCDTKCATQCATCEGWTNNCTKCADGFYFSGQAKDGVCNKCSDLCKTCAGSDTKCLTCPKDGEKPDENGVCKGCSGLGCPLYLGLLIGGVVIIVGIGIYCGYRAYKKRKEDNQEHLLDF